MNKKSILFLAIVSILVIGYLFIRTNLITVDADVPSYDENVRSVEEVDNRVIISKATYNKAKPQGAIKKEENISSQSTEGNISSEQDVKIDRRTLLKMIGATDELAWQEEYDKGIYTEVYDLTWQDDMYNRAYALAMHEVFNDDLVIDDLECKKRHCDLTLTKLESSTRSLGSLGAKYMLALKNHPAILESGKQRNVYIRSIGQADGKYQIKLSIY